MEHDGLTGDELTTAVLVLEAQFIVAPETALAEARALLGAALGEPYRLPVPALDHRDEFLDILSRLVPAADLG
jgi:hypothetical protein